MEFDIDEIGKCKTWELTLHEDLEHKRIINQRFRKVKNERSINLLHLNIRYENFEYLNIVRNWKIEGWKISNIYESIKKTNKLDCSFKNLHSF